MNVVVYTSISNTQRGGEEVSKFGCGLADAGTQVSVKAGSDFSKGVYKGSCPV